ncbi:tetratricopeptide repeat protein [Rariglobus hedericola]|uniref:Tetratricopeptide repeat protein n=1 Tax=Rariglobus hedericola TaxID=2597822 RepID=A0A556QPR6_9BACT|nr:tetratricopeptide repeat protein [Rariglobus hedericola]TSJ78592.1 tetratricopeptide repeat protein [Rariglobus hedericola]
MKSFLLILGGLVSVPAIYASTETHAAAPVPHAEVESAPTHAAPEHGPEKSAPSEAHATTPAATSEEIASLLRIGEAKSQQQDWASAELAYGQVLAAGRLATNAQVRAGLLGLARVYRGDRRLTKATAVYERYIKEYPDDEQLPVVYLELGRCLRALGAHRLAIARFYSVLNSTLKLPEEGSDNYRQLARTAQFEIAETYFQSGDYEQSYRFFSRLRLLDLAPADRARAAFKSAYSLNLKGDFEKTVTQLRAYLSLYPEGEDAPESRYLLSVSLRRLGRNQESLAATMDLLKIEKSRTDANPKTWSYWQRKTGNQLANEFYEQGEITTALAIYQCLRELGGPPDWLLPVQYQIGLCQERLHQPELARATYQSILDSLRLPSADSTRNSAVSTDITTMVTWRIQHLDWLEPTEKRLMLFSTPSTSSPPAVASTTP